MDKVESVILNYIGAYNAKDVDIMLGCFTDDVHFVNKSGDTISVEVHGKQAFRELAQQSLGFFSERHQSIENCIALGNHVTLRIAYRAVVATDLPNGWRAGQAIELSGISLFTLADGRIAKLVDIS
jgi:hypothetical protein